MSAPVAPDSPPKKAERRSATRAPEYREMIAGLRAARLAAGLRLEDVAVALDRPVSFVSKCETGERRIDPIDLWRFAELYGRPVADFLPKRRPSEAVASLPGEPNARRG